MKIRSKILVILVGMLAALNLLILMVAQIVIQSSYLRLEDSYMEVNVQRALSVIDDRLEKLDVTLKDWASWTDTYEYAAGKLPEYIQRNLMDAALVSLNVNLVIIVPSDGRTVYAKAVDIVSGNEIPLPERLSFLFEKDSPAISTITDGQTRKGLVLLPGHALLLAARPIFKSDGTGPSAGTFIMARFFDDQELQIFSQIVHLPLTRFQIDDPEIPLEIRKTLSSSLPEGRLVSIRKPSASLLEGFVILPDMTGKSGIVIRVQSSRDITVHGQTTVTYFLTAILLLSIAAGLTVWVLLRQVVLSRLNRLNSEAAQIKHSKDLSQRIGETGNDELSNVIHALNGMLDALEENQVQLQKARRNQALGQLAGGTAHEFNNILAIMQGSIEMVIDDPALTRSDSDLLQKAYRAGLRGKDIVAQIIDFSKTARQTHVAVALPVAVQEALEMCKPLFPQHITLVTFLGQAARPILANKMQIEQIVLNLCKNAIDAMGDAPGTLGVNVVDDRDGDFVVLYISDTGVGIHPSVGNQIFDPFFTTKQVGKGTGLGLSVVQGFMEQHQGNIEFTSNPGEGTTFILRFPVMKGEMPPETEGQILLVSQDPLSLRLPVLALETSGYQVKLESDATTALDLFRRDPAMYTLVLVDLAISDGTGLALCGKIWALNPEIRIYLLKDTDPFVSPHEMAEAGIRDILFKPLTVRALLEIV